MLRLLIGSGVLLMAVGFGAAGWQYYQGLPASVADAAETAPGPVAGGPSQEWLIAPSGGLVPRDRALAYLRQDRFVPDRKVTVRRSARLTDLLVQGEKLPDTPYLQALADIRAPMLAEGLCKVLIDTLAADCAVNAARVEDGTVDPIQGTAQFRLELVYRLKPEDQELPDLGAHVLTQERLRLEFDPQTEGVQTAEAALATLVSQAQAACGEDGQICRVTALKMDWSPAAPVDLVAEIAWLSPLPGGVFPVPPLEAAPGG